MTYAIVAYVLSLLLWLAYIASITARLKRENAFNITASDEGSRSREVRA